MNQDPSDHQYETTVRAAWLVAGALTVTLTVAACGGSEAPGNADASPAQTRAPAAVVIPDLHDAQLSLLERYESKTGVAPRMMEFIGFPQNTVEARIQAEKMAGVLQAWSAQNVHPLVIMEPTFNGGNTDMNLHKFQEGDYDEALSTYFTTLKSLGITDKQMGIWVPFPEPNIPDWAGGVTDPELFISNTTKVAQAIKQEFPKSHVSIMLDSQTCLPSPDPSWANCATNDVGALTRYLGFKPGLINSFGLQGFTWDKQDSPETFLSGQTAVACARKLGVSHVWFNTGTFSRVNNPNGEGIVKADNSRRTQVLDGDLAQGEVVQAAGLTMDFINVFGQNNFEPGSNGTGTADWQYNTRAGLGVLRAFSVAAGQRRIQVNIFDAAN
jgi:hypothetical protein